MYKIKIDNNQYRRGCYLLRLTPHFTFPFAVHCYLCKAVIRTTNHICKYTDEPAYSLLFNSEFNIRFRIIKRGGGSNGSDGINRHGDFEGFRKCIRGYNWKQFIVKLNGNAKRRTEWWRTTLMRFHNGYLTPAELTVRAHDGIAAAAATTRENPYFLGYVNPADLANSRYRLRAGNNFWQETAADRSNGFYSCNSKVCAVGVKQVAKDNYVLEYREPTTADDCLFGEGYFTRRGNGKTNRGGDIINLKTVVHNVRFSKKICFSNNHIFSTKNSSSPPVMYLLVLTVPDNHVFAPL